MADNVLRLLVILVLGVVLCLMMQMGLLNMYDVYDDRKIKGILIGAIGFIVGLSLSYKPDSEYEFQGFNDLMIRAITVGCALLFIVYGSDALYTSDKQVQIMVVSIILITSLYISTFIAY